MLCPLGPLLAHMFMVSLDHKMLSKLRSCLCNWRRLDDIFAYVLPSNMYLITRKLNPYHLDIMFTFELE